MMNQEIKKRWTAWLRANVGNQSKGRLHVMGGDYRPVGFCCLGGLCELAVADGVTTKTTMSEYNESQVGAYAVEEVATLPQVVWEWAGLTNSDPEVIVNDESLALTYLNDDLEWDFNQIADIIDEQL